MSGLTHAERMHVVPSRRQDAVVYCEANFGAIDGKTANGLVRHSEKYQIVAVIDSEHAGRDAGEALGEARRESRSVETSRMRSRPRVTHRACSSSESHPPAVCSRSTTEASSSRPWAEAWTSSADCTSSWETTPSSSPRKRRRREHPRRTAATEKKHLRLFDGSIARVACPRIAVLGTDCAIGKRTTARILTTRSTAVQSRP